MIKARTAIPGWFGVVGGRARLSQKHEESAWTANLNGLPKQGTPDKDSVVLLMGLFLSSVTVLTRAHTHTQIYIYINI